MVVYFFPQLLLFFLLRAVPIDGAKRIISEYELCTVGGGAYSHIYNMELYSLTKLITISG